MGFFKSIGNKLKRAVSLKNLTRAVTGQFSAIGSDVVRIASTTDPSKSKSVVDTTVVPLGYTLPPQVQDVLKQQENIYQKNVIDSVSSIPVVQDANSWMSKVYIQSMWMKYKNWVIGLGVVLLLVFGLRRLTRKKKNVRRR